MSSQGTRDRVADTGVEKEPVAERWHARPILAGALRGAIAVVPILTAIATTAALVRVLPSPEHLGSTVAVAVAVLAASTLVLVVVERLSRRLLPLTLLLQMSLLFPDKAPPRYRIARRAASVRQLRERVERAREVGRVDEPIRVAEDILTLIAGLTRHDRKTRGHSERVRVYTDLLTERLGLSTDDRERLRWASLIHDIGKLEVPSAVLNKPGRPNQSEWEQLKAHPAEGARIAAALLPWLGEWGLAIEHHHERWDGGGYPNALAGTQISMAGRIVSVADAYETMTAVRSYKSAMSHVAAREEVARCAGSQFDPHVVRAFLDIPLTQLVRVAGPVSWLIQLPLLRHLQPVASQLVPGLAASGANVATAAVLGTVAVASASQAHGHDHGHHHPSSSAAAIEVAPADEPRDGRDEAADGGDRPTVSDIFDRLPPGEPEPTDAPTTDQDRPSTTADRATSDPDQHVAVGGRSMITEPEGDILDLLDPTGAPGVDSVLEDPVGTATDAPRDIVDAVGGAADDPIGTVDDAVDTVTEVVEPFVPAPAPAPTAPSLPPVEDPVETITETVDPVPAPVPTTVPSAPALPGTGSLPGL